LEVEAEEKLSTRTHPQIKPGCLDVNLAAKINTIHLWEKEDVL